MAAPNAEEVFANGRAGFTFISGDDFTNRPILYRNHKGNATVEGDIVLGPMSIIEQFVIDATIGTNLSVLTGVVISGSTVRWPRKVIYYTIAPDLPKKWRVQEAIDHWAAKTDLRFAIRQNEQNYVTFIRGDGCASNIGMRGGQQFVWIADEGSSGQVIHEIGHTLGLWHEQSRSDRDNYVEIKMENVMNGKTDQFKLHINDGSRKDGYDYGSIMHYPSNAFAKDPTKPTIITKPPGKPIGQRDGLSDGDIKAVKSIYP
jgi:astacin